MKMAGELMIAYGKFQPSGISGKVTGGRSQKVPILPRDLPRDAQQLELSIGYHKHTSHFHMLFLLSRTITISLPHHQASLLLNQSEFLHKLVVIDSKISTIQQQTSD